MTKTAAKSATKAVPAAKKIAVPAANGKPVKPKAAAGDNGRINPRQLLILQALAKKDDKMTRAQLLEKTGVHPNWFAEVVGIDGEMKSDRISGKGPLKLSAAKWVKITSIRVDDGPLERWYEITPAGKKALAKAAK